MKKKYTILILSLIATIIPVFVFGEEKPSINIENVSGDGGLEEWFMHAFTYLDVNIGSRAVSVVELGKALGGITALIYFGYLGWQMQTGEKEWAFTPFIRPIFLCIIIINWVEFTNLVKYPFEKLTEYPKTTFSLIEQSASAKRNEVNTKRQEFKDFYNGKTDEARRLFVTLSYEERNQSGIKTIITGTNINGTATIRPDVTFKGLEHYSGFLDGVKTGEWISETFSKIALILLRVCVYLIFFIQKIWIYILVLLGPITVAFSMLPGFDNGFNNWLSKFITVSLYTFVAYTIINLGQQLIVGGYEMEMSRMQAIMDNEDLKNNPLLIANYDIKKMMSNTMMPSIVSYIVTGIGVLMTPTIADTIVSAGSAGLMSKTRGGASKMAAGSRLAGGAIKSIGKTSAARGLAGIAQGLASRAVDGIKKLSK